MKRSRPPAHGDLRRPGDTWRQVQSDSQDGTPGSLPWGRKICVSHAARVHPGPQPELPCAQG